MTEARQTPPANETGEHCFETALARLEAIVHRLEDGQLGLSESLAAYEEAVRYLRRCHEALQQAERQILVLTGVDAQGNSLTEPLDDQVLTLEQKQQRRGRRRSANAREAEAEPSSTAPPVDVDNQRGLF